MENPLIPDRLYFRIGDVAAIAGVKPYVLRYWESEFSLIAPDKSAKGQRVYRRGDVESVLLIKRLLYQERYSIEGARRRLKELRKDGQLKSARQSVTSKSAPEPQVEALSATNVNLVRARDLLRELETLAERPPSEFFKF